MYQTETNYLSCYCLRVTFPISRDKIIYHKYRFEPRQNQTDYIYINKNQGGCRAKAGMRGGRQVIRAGNCEAMNLVHELMHSLGKFLVHL